MRPRADIITRYAAELDPTADNYGEQVLKYQATQAVHGTLVTLYQEFAEVINLHLGRRLAGVLVYDITAPWSELDKKLACASTVREYLENNFRAAEIITYAQAARRNYLGNPAALEKIYARFKFEIDNNPGGRRNIKINRGIII